MKETVIVSAVRTAIGKAGKGTLRDTRPDDMGGAVIKAAVEKAGIDPASVEDVIMGCAMPEAEQGMNVARICSMIGGLPDTVPAQTVNRFCSSGLQAIAIASDRIATGQADIAIGGGTESMSMVPMGGNKIAPNPRLLTDLPDIYIGMGNTAEVVAQRYKISRDEQDEMAVRSHQNAAAAIKGGKFKDEIVPLQTTVKSGLAEPISVTFDTDEGVREETTAEGLGGLRTVFDAKGSVTAGNSSQMSDGAAAAVVMSLDKAKELGLKPMAYFRGFQVTGCAPDEMGIGPSLAVPKLLEKTGVKLEEIDLFELNEAFASQGVYCIKKLGLDVNKVNVNGGAIALGHPLGCTGAKLSATLLHELERRGGKYGIVTMCIGGGMGAAGLFERYDA